jgi:hypothetical protein
MESEYPVVCCGVAVAFVCCEKILEHSFCICRIDIEKRQREEITLEQRWQKIVNKPIC